MTTLNALKEGSPKHLRKMITQGVVDTLNGLEGDQGIEFAEVVKGRFLSHSKILGSGQYQMTDYINAIRYVSYKLLDHSNIDAYMLTFPDRYTRLMNQYADLGDEAFIRVRKISSFVSEYNSIDLVAKITEQSLVPIHILNVPARQDALNVLTAIMVDTGVSPKERVSAADSVLIHTKPPETTKISMDVNVGNSDAITDMQSVIRELALAQQKAIVDGSQTSLEIAESIIVQEEVIDVIAE